jgi:hypothetical protein
LKHNKESERPAPVATVQLKPSVQKETAPPLPVEIKTSTTEMNVQSESQISAPIKAEVVSTDSLIAATELIETALHKHDQTGEQLAVREPDPQTANVAPPLQSPHAGVVAQLEAWLRTIESRRRATAHVSRPKTS